MKLAEEVSARIDEGEKKGAVSMNDPESINEDEAPDAFRQVILKGVQQVIANLLDEMKGAMEEMVHTDWVNFEEVGDQSLYVTQICQTLHERFTEINVQLQPGVLRYLCDKFVATFMPRGPACQQLLLDLQVLKSLLPDLPNLGDPERFSQKDLRGYNRVIRRD
eukprot:gene14662-43579_t